MSEHEIKRESKRAFRAVMREMNSSVRFDTPEELEVLRANFAIARKRSLVGLLGGAAAGGIGWRFAVGNRLTPVATAWGALAGMTIGMFSVRQKMFLDLLSIPEEHSPFALRAREIIEREMPRSELIREIHRRRQELFPRAQDNYDKEVIWTEPPPSFEPFTTVYDVETFDQRVRDSRASLGDRPTKDRDLRRREDDASNEAKARMKRDQSRWDEQRHRASRGF